MGTSEEIRNHLSEIMAQFRAVMPYFGPLDSITLTPEGTVEGIYTTPRGTTHTFGFDPATKRVTLLK